MDLPLTITSIMRYGTSVFGDREVVTWTGDGTRRRTYAEAGRRAARLASTPGKTTKRQQPSRQTSAGTVATMNCR